MNSLAERESESGAKNEAHCETDREQEIETEKKRETGLTRDPCTIFFAMNLLLFFFN